MGEVMVYLNANPGICLLAVLLLLVTVDDIIETVCRRQCEKAVSDLRIIFDKTNAEHSRVVKQREEAIARLVPEIEARMAAEDANLIFSTILCEIVKKKRSKKKG